MNKLIYIPERVVLITLLLLVSVTTTVSGLWMRVQPGQSFGTLPVEMSHDQDFHNYFLPGFMLSVIVGNVNLIALIYVFRKDEKQYNFCIAGVVLMMAWVLLHMYMTEVFHWLQLLYLGIGVVMILLAKSLQIQLRKSYHH